MQVFLCTCSEQMGFTIENNYNGTKNFFKCLGYKCAGFVIQIIKYVWDLYIGNYK